MPDPCYTPDEILQLTGAEEHLSECDRCRALYEHKRQFVGCLPKGVGVFEILKAEGKQRVHAQGLLAKLQTIAPAERYAFLQAENALTPATILVLCEHAKHFHFPSPNQAEEWLSLAVHIANTIDQQPNRLQHGFLWALGKLALAQSNLSMSRGRVQAYHQQVSKALEYFQAVDDEFQQALAARGFLFSLAKMGQTGKAIKTALGCLPVLRAYGAESERSWLWINLSLVLLAHGRQERAARVLDLLLQRMPPEDPHYPLVLHNRVLIFLERQDPKRAREALSQLRSVVNSRGLRLEEARSYILEGEINLLQEHSQDALATLAKARELLHGEQAAYDLALIAVYEARAYTLQGESAKSLEQLHEAILFFSREGFAADLVHALEVWEHALVHAENVARRASVAAFDSFRNLSRPLPAVLYA